jgi:hypothetical protein
VIGLLALALIAPTQTYFVGDSVGTYLTVDVDANDSSPGRRMEEAQLPTTTPGDTIVIELGTNNLLEPETWIEVDFIFDAIPRGVCVWWVSPYAAYFPAETAAFRQKLDDTFGASCGGVIPWGQVAQPFHTYDLVHPNNLGAFYLSALIDQSLNPNQGPLG